MHGDQKSAKLDTFSKLKQVDAHVAIKPKTMTDFDNNESLYKNWQVIILFMVFRILVNIE